MRVTSLHARTRVGEPFGANLRSGAKLRLLVASHVPRDCKLIADDLKFGVILGVWSALLWHLRS